MLETNQKAKYLWWVHPAEEYQLENEVEENTSNLCFIRNKEDNSTIYKMTQILGEGIEGIVYSISPENQHGRSKCVKIIQGDMPELWILKKIYLHIHPQLKTAGIELKPKGFFIFDDLSIKVRSEYDCDLNSFIFKNEPETVKRYAEKIIRQLSAGLATMHECNIALLDIKLENILCRFKTGKVRFDFADFGILTKDFDVMEIPENRKQHFIRYDFSLFKGVITEIINKVCEEHFQKEFLDLMQSHDITTAKAFNKKILKFENVIIN